MHWVVNQSLPKSHACKSIKTVQLRWQARNCDKHYRLPNRQIHHLGGRYFNRLDYSIQVVRHLGANRHPNEEHFWIDVFVVQAWNFSPSPGQSCSRRVYLQDYLDSGRPDFPLRHDWLQLRPALWKILFPLLHGIPNSIAVLVGRNLAH